MCVNILEFLSNAWHVLTSVALLDINQPPFCHCSWPCCPIILPSCPLHWMCPLRFCPMFTILCTYLPIGLLCSPLPYWSPTWYNCLHNSGFTIWTTLMCLLKGCQVWGAWGLWLWLWCQHLPDHLPHLCHNLPHHHYSPYTGHHQMVHWLPCQHPYTLTWLHTDPRFDAAAEGR